MSTMHDAPSARLRTRSNITIRFTRYVQNEPKLPENTRSHAQLYKLHALARVFAFIIAHLVFAAHECDARTRKNAHTAPRNSARARVAVNRIIAYQVFRLSSIMVVDTHKTRAYACFNTAEKHGNRWQRLASMPPPPTACAP